MKKNRNTRLLYTGLTLLILLCLAGCGSDGGVTGPENPPFLSNGKVVTTQPVHPSATIVLHIDYIDVSATMNEGVAYITDSVRTYQDSISNAPDSSGVLVLAFDLSPLAKPGQELLRVWVRNKAGISSNSIEIPLTVEP